MSRRMILRLSDRKSKVVKVKEKKVKVKKSKINMKHQQVVVDYWNMIKTSFTCLLLAFSGYILIK